MKLIEICRRLLTLTQWHLVYLSLLSLILKLKIVFIKNKEKWIFEISRQGQNAWRCCVRCTQYYGNNWGVGGTCWCTSLSISVFISDFISSVAKLILPWNIACIQFFLFNHRSHERLSLADLLSVGKLVYIVYLLYKVVTTLIISSYILSFSRNVYFAIYVKRKTYIISLDKPRSWLRKCREQNMFK